MSGVMLKQLPIEDFEYKHSLIHQYLVCMMVYLYPKVCFFVCLFVSLFPHVFGAFYVWIMLCGIFQLLHDGIKEIRKTVNLLITINCMTNHRLCNFCIMTGLPPRDRKSSKGIWHLCLVSCVSKRGPLLEWSQLWIP